MRNTPGFYLDKAMEIVRRSGTSKESGIEVSREYTHGSGVLAQPTDCLYIIAALLDMLCEQHNADDEPTEENTAN